MRGTVCLCGGVGRVLGIIPAHAGNSLLLAVLQAQRRDHPRACGEQVSVLGNERTVMGIIPAHAGNSTTLIKSGTLSRDHPRACGEQLPFNELIITEVGSSPRMRGTVVSNL